MSTDESNWGVPRELIPWGPTIDPARCRGSGECVRFCPNNVYEFEESIRQARVARFHQ
jgi:NAD-dependent dihydropyrimidine dehydrogenase PreA subunit